MEMLKKGRASPGRQTVILTDPSVSYPGRTSRSLPRRPSRNTPGTMSIPLPRTEQYPRSEVQGAFLPAIHRSDPDPTVAR